MPTDTDVMMIWDVIINHATVWKILSSYNYPEGRILHLIFSAALKHKSNFVVICRQLHPLNM